MNIVREIMVTCRRWFNAYGEIISTSQGRFLPTWAILKYMLQDINGHWLGNWNSWGGLWK